MEHCEKGHRQELPVLNRKPNKVEKNKRAKAISAIGRRDFRGMYLQCATTVICARFRTWGSGRNRIYD